MIELYRCSSSWFCAPPTEQFVLIFSTLSARLLKIYSCPPTLSIGFTKSLQNRRKTMLFVLAVRPLSGAARQLPRGGGVFIGADWQMQKSSPFRGSWHRAAMTERVYFSASSSTCSRCRISSGFAIWPFMPARRAFCRSSSKALAVMAKMGTPALRGSDRARMRRVAS